MVTLRDSGVRNDSMDALWCPLMTWYYLADGDKSALADDSLGLEWDGRRAADPAPGPVGYNPGRPDNALFYTWFIGMTIDSLVQRHMSLSEARISKQS